MKPGLSRGVVTATLLVCAALVGALVFTLIRSSDTASRGGSAGSLPAVPGPTTPAAVPSPVSPQPYVSPSARSTTTRPSVPSAPSTDSPKFKPGQWIAVLDTYRNDGALPAEQSARDLAQQLVDAGISARALAAKGQYPGLYRSDGLPMRDAWIVYVGPSGSSGGARNVCAAAETQRVYSSPACPTFEPATGPGR